MTREEILAMVPGRELDAVIAEKVMGWRRVEMTPQNNGWFWSDGKKHVAWDSFSPSTDISAAWEVVEKMVPRFTQLTRRHADVWYCGFSTVDSVEASTAPEAICKAALIEVMDL